MQLCENNHKEICFEGKSCPLCDYINDSISDIKSLENELDNLKKENEELHDRIVELEKIISENNFKE